MADERQQPDSQVGDEPTPIDPATAPEPIKEMQAKTIREIRAESVPSEHGEGGHAVNAAEDALNKPIEAVEDVINQADALSTAYTPSDVMPHIVGDTTTLFGRVIKLSVYDVVFISLAIFTVIEVLTGTLLPHIWLTILILIVIAFVKAFHVVWFYMHLSQDNRIFWLTLALPFMIAILGLFFLIAVPPTSY